jgi:peptidoglycan/LPS O-acetylase OafA/YrhL
MSANYIPSLDGLRTISVFIVVFAHAGLGHLIPGGLGVTIFFFLSGFLITTLLASEFDRNKTINYPHFFARRFLRLFPPLFATLAVTYGLYFSGLIEGGASWEGLLSQIFYLANYHAIFHWPGEIPKGLDILWSLAVEEHFYLFFPLLMLFLLRRVGSRNTAISLALLCVVVLLWRLYLVEVVHVETYRTYYATDTRIDSILFGCIFAMLWNPINAERKATLSRDDWAFITGGVALLLFTLLYRDPSFRETYRYSLQGIALMPIFYYAVKASDSWLFSWLNWSWMRKLGVYSYFIYLIHFVVITFLKYNDIATSIPGIIIGTTVIAVFYSFVLDRYIDVHFRPLRKKYRGS